jgi:hypothetical protein
LSYVCFWPILLKKLPSIDVRAVPRIHLWLPITLASGGGEYIVSVTLKDCGCTSSDPKVSVASRVGVSPALLFYWKCWRRPGDDHPVTMLRENALHGVISAPVEPASLF